MNEKRKEKKWQMGGPFVCNPPADRPKIDHTGLVLSGRQAEPGSFYGVMIQN